jgi:hypothetical protein
MARSYRKALDDYLEAVRAPPNSGRRSLLSQTIGRRYSILKGRGDMPAKKILLKDAKWYDHNNRAHTLYTVRSMGPGRGFGILNTFLSAFICPNPFSTRADARAYMAETFDR